MIAFIFRLLLLSVFVAASCTTKVGSRKTSSIDGVTTVKTNERIIPCNPPDKRYSKDVTRAVKTQLTSMPNLPDIEFETETKKNVIALSDYSSKGLDIDLLLYRFCEITTNRGFSPEQTKEFYQEQSRIWFMALDDKQEALSSIQKSQEVIIKQNLEVQNELQRLKEMFDNKYRKEGLEISKRLSEKYNAGHVIFGIIDGKFYYPPINQVENYDFVINYDNIQITESPTSDLAYRVVGMVVSVNSTERNVDLSLGLNFDIPKSPSEYSRKLMTIAPELPVPYFEMIDGDSTIPIYAIGWRLE
ncbi:hypothetical protein [Lewinella sp. IMCC34183]|uniref:hypothetical protein n=1 Tax=Lewinella sp. IMCC34183 TaxID=2248762 RepID=UPI0013008BD6|nr:hypothetical protein [Lewinella sp. IMCC34183]